MCAHSLFSRAICINLQKMLIQLFLLAHYSFAYFFGSVVIYVDVGFCLTIGLYDNYYVWNIQ